MLKSSLALVARFNRRHLISIMLVALTLCSPVRIARAQTANSRPQLLPNTKKYSERGLQPATGRSGSASLTTRALLGNDGKTSVEMTTGGLDGGDARLGNINKAQLKPLDENGNALYARNYTGLQSGGYFTTIVNDLHRGQQVQAQANIDGLETGRNNVVTVVETVKLRPDMALSNFSAPANAAPGNPINISVVLRELNGDAGATANLVLYVDGTLVDRTQDVWVDAGGTVSCVFTHKFTSAGSKQLEVKVERAAPGDYDVSNNSVSGSVQVGPFSSDLNYNVQVFDMDEDYRSHIFERRFFNGVLQSEREEDFSSRGWRQAANFYGWTGRMITFPISISHNETNDGASVFSNSYSNLTPTSVIDASDGVTRFISHNVWRYDPVTGYYFNLYTNATINLTTGGRVETTFFSSNRQAGDVTYYSAGYERFWDGYTGEEFFYSWNTTDISRAGTRIPFGTSYGINIALTAGDGAVYVASPVVNLSAFDNSGSQPYTCFDWAFDEYSGTSCVQYDAIRLGKHGYAYRDSNP